MKLAQTDLGERLIFAAIVLLPVLMLAGGSAAYIIGTRPSDELPSAEGSCREMLIKATGRKTTCPHVDHAAEPVASEPPAIFCRCWSEGDPGVER